MGICFGYTFRGCIHCLVKKNVEEHVFKKLPMSSKKDDDKYQLVQIKFTLEDLENMKREQLYIKIESLQNIN